MSYPSIMRVHGAAHLKWIEQFSSRFLRGAIRFLDVVGGRATRTTGYILGIPSGSYNFDSQDDNALNTYARAASAL